MTLRDVYARQPLCYQGGIPVFSVTNEYVINYEKIAADHLEYHRETGKNPWIEELLWLELEDSTASLIRKYIKSGQYILDVGVGMGRLLSAFPDIERYGMDISFGYLHAAQREGINVCYSLVEDMPYVEECFDLVVCTDVLEHVLDLNLACRKILSVLKKNGILIIRVPYRENLAPYRLKTCPYEYAHLRNFDENSLYLLFERIFRCEVLETLLTGHDAAASKLRDLLPIAQSTGSLNTLGTIAKWLMRNTGKILKVINEKTYESFRTIFYNPAGINVVVRKV